MIPSPFTSSIQVEQPANVAYTPSRNCSAVLQMCTSRLTRNSWLCEKAWSCAGKRARDTPDGVLLNSYLLLLNN